MSKSLVPGALDSVNPEVLGLTPHALWMLVGDREFMLDFVTFPWFAQASIQQVCNVQLLHGQHLHWPDLDVDLHLESLQHPERFPLLANQTIPPTGG
jgi:Protein of unknown function (DUF2442)